MHDRSITDRVRRALLAVALLALPLGTTLSAPAAAQAPAAASQITGTVLDPNGKPLGKARIAVTGAVNQSVESGPDGRFSFSVPPGIYTVTVQAAGFEKATNESVVLTAGQTATLSFTLLSSTLQTIGRTSTTTSGATTVNTTSASVDTITNATIVSQGQTQVLNVLDQTPGVEVNRSTSNEPGGNSSISIRGAQPYESQILIDGHPVVTSANGAFGFNSTFINSLLLSNIEVSKGPGSYPNTVEDAIGGSLNFRTPNITAKPTFSALLGYDTYSGNYFGVRFSDTFGKVGVLVGAAGYSTPGYLQTNTLYGGNNDAAAGFPVYPNPQLAGNYGPNAPGYLGVINFAYPATSNFGSNSQLVKIAYNFSPQTSVTFGTYATQTNLDETGNNDQSIYAKIVGCINNAPGGPPTPCPPLTATPNYNVNYTSNPYLRLIGTVQPINFYAAYPNTTEFDNEPLYTGEFRTVIGPGSLLARYYTATITRTVTQESYPSAIGPCYSPACPFDPNSPANTNGYPGEPYIEPTIDELHGVDAQYSVPFGANSVTLGFDRHVDNAAFAEDYDYTTGVPAGFAFIPIQSISYSLRGDFPLTDKFDLSAGGYLSNTTYVGTRFDPRGGVTYKITPNAVIRASAGSAFVAPYYSLVNPTPYVSDSVLYAPTTNFKPETSMGYDVGTDVKFSRNDLISFDAYLTNIFNRYATVSVPGAGMLGTKTYSSITENGNQANVRNEGLELAYRHLPRVGIGFETAVDILRDYAYNQSASANDDNIFIGGSPADGVQLPGYPYSKIRNDLSYTFKSQAQVRLSSTTYGENNPFGEPAFTEFDGAIRLPVSYGAFVNIGATNVFNRDNGQAGGIYNGGYTYPTVGGGIGPTGLYYVTPRTVYVQLQKTVGASR